MHRVAVNLLVLVASAAALTCNVMTTTPTPPTQVCPANVYNCLKFVCKTNGMEMITKGCDDPNNVPVSQSYLMSQCQQRGGKGKVHLCSFEMCNPTSALSVLTAIIASVFYTIL